MADASATPLPPLEWVFGRLPDTPDVTARNYTVRTADGADIPMIWCEKSDAQPGSVVVYVHGGGMICGIASALRAMRPQVKIYASEIDTGAPFAPSLAAGHPVEVAFTPSFADGISDAFVNPEMLELAKDLVDGSIVVSKVKDTLT